ncbi:replicative DNA helicase [Hartmannibacter diazotrophicus]|uniref:Replicative DNA helicase n=1 Tax=Hartmannibacter diazotrophicus TaxID=1482074 RepID=A0A2C9D0U6_9HYPH|nr:DNA helicase [Hartmannibacter diazotrophicus]SON53866.1 replicative DNA helicase [Hartmannibacter diazotrophicus]
MRLSSPVYRLKRQARLLSRQEKIPLHAALDRIAQREGFAAWSLLAARLTAEGSPAARMFARLDPGDLVLVGARPGHGKTLMSLELAIEAVKAGNTSHFFTLEYTEQDVRERLKAVGVTWSAFAGRFDVDTSDGINAAYIMQRLEGVPPGALAVVDYLQALDQKRDNPDLESQIRALKVFARERGHILVFVSQIDRAYESADRPVPGLGDVRLPNPLDLSLFSKSCFLSRGEVRFEAAG